MDKSQLSPQRIEPLELSSAPLQPELDLFPFCVVWTTIPCLSWLVPFIGHTGIGDSNGLTFDFLGYINKGTLGFGRPLKFLKISNSKPKEFNEAIRKANIDFQGTMHNLFTSSHHKQQLSSPCRHGSQSNQLQGQSRLVPGRAGLAHVLGGRVRKGLGQGPGVVVLGVGWIELLVVEDDIRVKKQQQMLRMLRNVRLFCQTHKDFQKVNKLQSNQEVLAFIDSVVKANKVVLFMKGNPKMPMCGYSNFVVQRLKKYQVNDYKAVNVLEDGALREQVKNYSKWPTYPQLWINGKLVGGSDIINQLEKQGKFQAMLEQEKVI